MQTQTGSLVIDAPQRRAQRGLAAAALLALASACGGGSGDTATVSPCDHLAAAAASLEVRAESCALHVNLVAGTCGTAACAGSSEQAEISSFARCLDAVHGGSCEDAQYESLLIAQLDACEQIYGGLDAACSTALSGGAQSNSSSAWESVAGECPAAGVNLTGTGAPGAACSDETTCAPVCCTCPNGDGRQFLAAACSNQACAASADVCALALQGAGANACP